MTTPVRPGLDTWPRFILWATAGVALALIVLIFLMPCLLLLVLTVAGIAGYRGGRTALGGLLVGLALPVAWFGYEAGARDRECTAGGIGPDGVEYCTQWVAAGMIRWPWYLTAGALLITGLALHLGNRRTSRHR